MNTLLCIGEARFGKTPLMTILAMAAARFHADAAGKSDLAAVRTSPEIDFFRGEVGQKWVPCIFDDGDLRDTEGASANARRYISYVCIM